MKNEMISILGTNSNCLQAALAALFCVIAINAAKADEATINAYATWDGRGQIYPTGLDTATFVGAFTGTLFVERSGNIANSGNIVCPAVIEMNLNDGSQTGRGKCTISNSEGERVFGEWMCSGTQFVGCDGKFQLTAGTGEYNGITGEGDFILRTGLQAVATSSVGNIVQRAASGLAIWRNLKFKTPE